ncbi:hypothetical protein [Paenibacillus polymyxa]|uniref:hypothetical protein n=1 Tax=Paenibacillus polymyxa TaxID=1406 RepID=UPI0021E3D587|nr:hypothetical protein [Paenibacillus polymyxa]
MALSKDSQYTTYKKHAEEAGCTVKRDGDVMFINERYKVHLSNGQTTDTITGEKTRNVYGLISKLKLENSPKEK